MIYQFTHLVQPQSISKILNPMQKNAEKAKTNYSQKAHGKISSQNVKTQNLLFNKN